MSRKSLALACLALIGASEAAHSTIVIQIGAATLSDHTGSPLAANSLIQLIDLGPNGVFDAISLTDGNTSGLNQWVSGDDSVLNIAFKSIVGANPVAGDFPSTAAFDLSYQTDATPGFLDRSFEFELADLTPNTKLGIRWFPGLLASDLATITLTDNQRYGEFTRLTAAVNGFELWMAPADGARISFDPLITQSFGGSESNSLGAANLIVPEPAAIGMSLIGAAGLALLRRRRP